jgi:uncharacterized protein YjiS (DUF1127 family)
MPTVLSTHRPWTVRWFDALVDRWRARRQQTPLHGLDPRTLADIGVDASEISSIAAEANALAQLTRLRVAAQGHHG